MAVIFAVTQKQAAKRGISAFLVPTSTPGYKVARIEEKTGQRASDTAQIVLENCKAEELLGAGRRRLPHRARQSRVGPHQRRRAGDRRRARRAGGGDRLRARAQEHGQGADRAPGGQLRLADMATQVEAARQLYLHAARLRDAGKPCLKEASMAKLFASEMAEKVCSDAIQIHGGYGYVSDFPVERLWRDVRVTKIYEGANDIQRLVIGRALEEG